jgi:hypothetical protein
MNLWNSSGTCLLPLSHFPLSPPRWHTSCSYHHVVLEHFFLVRACPGFLCTGTFSFFLLVSCIPLNWKSDSMPLRLLLNFVGAPTKRPLDPGASVTNISRRHQYVSRRDNCALPSWSRIEVGTPQKENEYASRGRSEKLYSGCILDLNSYSRNSPEGKRICIKRKI